MNITDMRSAVRLDLHDSDPTNYRWSDDEIDRHIARAVKEFSGAIPLEQKAVLPTVPGSREIDISSITDCVVLEAVEYPAECFPVYYRRFSVWGNTLYLLDDIVPDGSDCNVYYGKLHTLNTVTSTLTPRFEELVAAGAAGYAVLELAVFSINKTNTGGVTVPGDFMQWGTGRLHYFQAGLKRLGKGNRVRVRSLYRPCQPPVSKTTDFGP